MTAKYVVLFIKYLLKIIVITAINKYQYSTKVIRKSTIKHCVRFVEVLIRFSLETFIQESCNGW